MLVLIRVFTTNNQDVLNSHAKKLVATFKRPVKTCCIPDQFHGIHDEVTEKIVHTASRAEAAGASCVIISCATDPGVAEARAALHIPVIGAGSAAAGISLSIGARVGVLNLSGPTSPRIAALLGDHLVAEARPIGVSNTTDLLTRAGQNAAFSAAFELEQRVDVIMFGCTGYTTIELKKKLQNRIGVPIVDAVEAAGAVACSRA